MARQRVWSVSLGKICSCQLFGRLRALDVDNLPGWVFLVTSSGLESVSRAWYGESYGIEPFREMDTWFSLLYTVV